MTPAVDCSICIVSANVRVVGWFEIVFGFSFCDRILYLLSMHCIFASWCVPLLAWVLDWLQSLKIISSMCHIIYLLLVLLWWLCFNDIWYDTLMKNCFKDWSQSTWVLMYLLCGAMGLSRSAIIEFQVCLIIFWLLSENTLYYNYTEYFHAIAIAPNPLTSRW